MKRRTVEAAIDRSRPVPGDLVTIREWRRNGPWPNMFARLSTSARENPSAYWADVTSMLPWVHPRKRGICTVLACRGIDILGYVPGTKTITAVLLLAADGSLGWVLEDDVDPLP